MQYESSFSSSSSPCHRAPGVLASYCSSIAVMAGGALHPARRKVGPPAWRPIPPSLPDPIADLSRPHQIQIPRAPPRHPPPHATSDRIRYTRARHVTARRRRRQRRKQRDRWVARVAGDNTTGWGRTRRECVQEIPARIVFCTHLTTTSTTTTCMYIYTSIRIMHSALVHDR